MLAQLRPLTAHLDERGRLTEIHRASDDPHGYGQAYITTAAAGVVKAWHRHQRQWDRWYCVAGAAKVGIEWTESGTTSSTLPTSATIYNDVIRGGEGVPTVTAAASFKLLASDSSLWTITIDPDGTLSAAKT